MAQLYFPDCSWTGCLGTALTCLPGEELAALRPFKNKKVNGKCDVLCQGSMENSPGQSRLVSGCSVHKVQYIPPLPPVLLPWCRESLGPAPPPAQKGY